MFPAWCNTPKNIGNDQKPMCRSCIAIEPHNFKILLFLQYGVISTLYNSKMLLSLHYFLTPQFQTFNNLLIGIFWVSNPTFFVSFLFFWNFWEINTVLQCYLLSIFVSIRRLPPPHTHIYTHTHLKNITPSFISFCQAPF